MTPKRVTLITGVECDDKGCPGTGESCSGHGACTIADQSCLCDTGWKSDGCDQPDCPGTPDCSGIGK